MRHRKARLQLNRFSSWRKATLVSLARNLLIHQSIRTTKTKAQAVKSLIERLISLAKENTVFARREAFKIIGEHRLVQLLFDKIGPRFNNRGTGFTRMINVGLRRGDNAKLAILELTEIKKEEKKRPKKEKEKEVLPEGEKKPPAPKEQLPAEKKLPTVQKPSRKFLGGLRRIFKKERDSL